MIVRISLNVVMAGMAILLLTVGASTGLAGQQTSQSPSADPAPRPSAPSGDLNLERALAAALLLNPELTAFSYDVRAAQARVLQARVLPNPELELEVEEIDRGGEGFASVEIAVSLGQRFELGGKRRWRTRMAQAESELAGWDYEARRLDVFAETARRFTVVIAAQERLELARSAAGLAEQTSRAVAERVRAGKEPPLQVPKSEAELEMARLQLREAESALAVARLSLAAMWGAERAEFGRVEGTLDQPLAALPSLDELRPRLAQNPELARGPAELGLRRAALSLERAARIPDLEGSMGYLRSREDGTDAFALGIGVPLPIFDRNQGSVAAAAQELSSAGAERSAAEIALAAELATAQAALADSHRRVEALRTKVVPAMELAFQATREGYDYGKFGFLELLDAQRRLFESRGALVDALSEYQTAWIEIQRLTGTGVEELTTGRG